MYVDGTFAPAKKGALALERVSAAKGPKSWQLQTAHDVTLVDQLLRSRFFKNMAERLIGDMAYDSDELDGELREIGVEMIAPLDRIE